MLLVDHDQARVMERYEDRGARSDDHPGFAAQRRHPSRPAFGHVLRAMHDRRQRPETLAKGADDLIRQGDFRHQHDHLAAGLERLRRKLDVDLGLAAARDPPQ